MKFRWLLVFLFACPELLQGQEVAGPRIVTLSLPLNVAPETVLIHAGIYGQGLYLSQVQTRSGVFDYPIDLDNSGPGPATSLKVLVYIPGYRMVAYEFKDAELAAGRVLIPPLTNLQTTVLKGVLVDSSARPLADQTLHVSYFFLEVMNHFGYSDGSVPSIPIGNVKTNAMGEFAIDIPSLLEDPFFQTSDRYLAGNFVLSTARGSDPTLNPRSFPAQKTYKPLVVRKTQYGTLSGRLEKEFLQQNGLSDDLRTYIRPGDTIPLEIELRARARDGGSSFIADLQVDGSFEIRVLPGEYDLMLWVSRVQELIPFQNGLVVEEGKRRIVVRP